MTSLFLICAAALALLAGPAKAQRGSDWRDCNGRDADARISACSRIIDKAGGRNSTMRAGAFNNRGIAYFSKGEFDRAIRDFDEAIAAKPNNPVLHHNRGLALYNKGDNEGAIRSYEEAISIHPKYAMAHNDRANVYFRMKEYDRAISGYDDAIRLQPRDPIVYANRGNTYRMKGDYDRALRDFEEAIRLNPREPGSIYGRSQVYIDKGDTSRAIADLDEAIRLGPNNADYYNSRGFLLKKQGENDRAIRDFDEAIKLKPRFATAFSNRGDAWRQRGDIERAIMDLSEAIRLDPTVTPAYVSRGLAYEAKGDIEQAKFDFSTVLSRTPGNFATSREAVAKARERLAALEGSTGATGGGPLPAITPAPRSEPRPGMPSRAGDATERGPRVALVIGNAAYSNVPSLANPVNDAREMSSALRELGFKVIEGYNLNSTTMRSKIAEFGNALPGAGVSLFYYAGHGMQVSGRNYLVPVDAKVERPSALGTEAIEVNTVIADMESEKRINLVFLDACRDNPLSRNLARSMGGGTRSSAVGQGLAQLNAGIGTLITFATSPDTIALDGSGRNSPFTQAMLKYIRTPGLEVRSMLTRVRADVIRATNEQQVPWDHSSLTGDFYFKPGS
ncbi:tetratricopeptide repeat protein [Bradyrhizobium sp.]|uniref:tetratricopeptide repeat protein n=1 Tax=Bradyrhizobium sp. TaxID=376 RepID=UPI004037D18D